MLNENQQKLKDILLFILIIILIIIDLLLTRFLFLVVYL